jgi:hypothetical protein
MPRWLWLVVGCVCVCAMVRTWGPSSSTTSSALQYSMAFGWLLFHSALTPSVFVSLPAFLSMCM